MTSQEKPPKAMSSRLLTMKFMQRAAASSPSSAENAGRHPNKRPRLSEPTPGDKANSNLEAAQTALAAEDQKRIRALERQATEAGDTKWTLNLDDQEIAPKWTGLNVVHAGYSDIDSDTMHTQTPEEASETGWGGSRTQAARKSFGKFKGTLEKPQKPADGQDPSSSPGDAEEESNSDSAKAERDSSEESFELGRAATSNASHGAETKRKAKIKEDRVAAGQERKRRRNEVAKVSSISARHSSSQNTSPLSSGQSAQGCFGCGSIGHKKKDCPKSKRGSSGR